MNRRLRTSLALGAALAALLSLPSCSKTPGDELWIVGLDGADWDILEPMIATGDLPNLAQLRREGAWGRLRSEEPMLSPILWTTLATGRAPDEHGVTWFMTDGPNGEKIPVSSRNRDVRAMWNVAHDHHHESGVVGWWATWPVEPIDGWIVSDYVGWHSFGVTGRELDVPGRVWPTDLEEFVDATMPSPDDVDDALLQTMVNLPADKLGFDPDRGPFGGPLPHLRQAIATSRGYTDVVLRQLDSGKRPELLALYYEGTDAVKHLFTSYAPPKLPWVSQEDFDAFRDAIRGYYIWQDELLGELLERRGPNTTVMIISDHGFRTGEERLREEQFEVELADASHMLDGIVMLHGPGIPAGTRLRGADLYDVAPTALHLLGIPLSEEMEGEVIRDAFSPEWWAEHPESTQPSYEVGEWDRGDDLVLDPAAGENMEEMLRSLGYISGGSDESSEEGGATEVLHDAENAVNLSLILRQRGKYHEAVTELEKVLDVDPTHVEARVNLAQTYGESGDLTRAQEIYGQLVEEDPTNLQHREDLAVAYALAGDAARAMASYEGGLEVDPEWTVGLAGRGFALHKLGRSEEGISSLERAIELDPRLADAHYYLGGVRLDLGQAQPAERSLRRAMSLDPTNERALVRLTEILEQTGRADEALKMLADATEMQGETSTLLGQSGAIELRRGRWQVAKPLIERSLELKPGNADMMGNLGICQAMAGDIPGATRTFERVVRARPDFLEARAQLGNFYLQQRNAPKAIEHLSKAVELAPDDPNLHASLGSAYHGGNQLDLARQEYDKALAIEPEHAMALYQLGMLTGMEGDRERALELIERARKIDPSLPFPGRQ